MKSDLFTRYEDTPGLNFSQAKHLLDSERHYLDHVMNPEEEDTDSRTLGNAVHLRLLMDERPESAWAVKPAGMSFATKEGKAWRAEVQSQGLTVVTHEMSVAYATMIREATSHQLIEIIDSAPEREFILTDTWDGVPVKGLLDVYDKRRMIMDLKTARDASPHGFGKAIADGSYLLQAAWYRRLARTQLGWYSEQFVWAAIQNCRPWCIAMYYATPDQLEFGDRLLHLVLARYQRLLERGMKWEAAKGYDPVGPARVPLWYLLRDLEI